MDSPIAEIIAVHPNRVCVAVYDIDAFRRGGSGAPAKEDIDESRLRVGSYIRITDNEGGAILAIIDHFTLEPAGPEREARHILEAAPIGFITMEGRFVRGGTRIAIPPKGAEPARLEDVQAIFDQTEARKRFTFSSLAQEPSVRVHTDGDSFFNKHIAIVGSTGSGKSHALARILQHAILATEGGYDGLNNSHILLFDLHGEYKSAFPNGNLVTVDELELPYWLMNGEELQELFVEAGDMQAYNQISLLRRLVRLNKIKFGADERVSFDTPVRFDVRQVLTAMINLNSEQVRSKSGAPAIACEEDIDFSSDDERLTYYFDSELKFDSSQKRDENGTRRGPFCSELDRFLSRLRSKVEDPRLSFLFSQNTQDGSLESVLRQLLGYDRERQANVTVLDLSGVPFEVLSITVSLISRMVFDFAYHLKRAQQVAEMPTDKVPFLLVYEEAHKYVPKDQSSRYRACQFSIERIAKEGRKYGTTLIIVSQRPSEISETIFAQCNNFVAMRLTNPEDQNYVRRLLPDSLGPIVEALPTLRQGEALVIGDSVPMPCQVSVERCDPSPSSVDIEYLQEWKKHWVDAEFAKVAERWVRR